MSPPRRKIVQSVLLGSRWLLAPFYLMLICGLAVLLISGGEHLWKLVSHIGSGNESEVTLGLLKLIDLTLLASLLVIVIVSGFENFVSHIEREDTSDWPVWMSQIDFSDLKLKLIATITAIAAIQLLEVYMDVENVKDRDIMAHAALLVTFALVGLIMAITDYLAGIHHQRDS